MENPSATTRRLNLMLFHIGRCSVLAQIGFVIFLIVSTITVQIKRSATRNPGFVVDYIAVSPLNISKSSKQITANWTIGVTVHNRIGIGRLGLNNLGVTVMYNKTEFLAKTLISTTCFLGPNHRKTFSATPTAYLQGLSNSVPEDMFWDHHHGRIDFDVALYPNLTFFYRGKKHTQFYRGASCVLCKDIEVRFPEAGKEGRTVVAGPYPCSHTDFLEDYLSPVYL